MQYIRIEVEAVRPHDRAKLRIDPDPSEITGVLQRFGHRPPEIAGQINPANHAIGEGQPQPEAAQGLDSGNTGKNTSISYGNGSILASSLRSWASSQSTQSSSRCNSAHSRMSRYVFLRTLKPHHLRLEALIQR